jgi:uncharacterized protein (DUF1800 family)
MTQARRNRREVAAPSPRQSRVGCVHARSTTAALGKARHPDTGKDIMIRGLILCAVLLVLCFACGHAHAGAAGQDLIYRDGFEVPGGLPPSRAEASRFLAQATFGVDRQAVDDLMVLGYERWLDAQMALPPAYVLPYMRAASGISGPVTPIPFHYYRQGWFVRVLSAPDQLRQRVAFALSQIMVVSERGNSLANDGLALGAYHDILLRNAFGNFRQLLEDVTLSPAMGRYLSMYRNRKPDPINNIQADENYAREVMQLFTIGLVELNPDGTPRLVNGQTVPTYDVAIVRALARVFTGWACHCAQGQNCVPDPFPAEPFTCSTEQPMVPFENYHDRGEKRLFRNVVLPANRDARPELEAALDALFEHPNVGPFIGRQLIQRLVTSNPTPAYVQRVAAVFDDNGSGVRGDLAAVVRAILLDPEARHGHRTDPTRFGKVREPLLRLTQLWRAFDVAWKDDGLMLDDLDIHLRYNQSPLFSPSVFNFYSPSYAPSGPVAQAGMVAPEMQVITADYAIKMTNDLVGRIFWGWLGGPMDELDPRTRTIDLAPWEAMIRPVGGSVPEAGVERLIDGCAELLLGGQISPGLRALIATRIGQIPPAQTLERVQNTLFLITSSPEYAVQR